MNYVSLLRRESVEMKNKQGKRRNKYIKIKTKQLENSIEIKSWCFEMIRWSGKERGDITLVLKRIEGT